MGIGHAVLVHGAGGGAWEWSLWRGVLAARGIAVATPELMPGAGGLAATAFDDYEAQVRRSVLAMPRPRALVGASLGGLLAMRCADLADALVLVNPLPPVPWTQSLPSREYPDVVTWRQNARLDGTRRALPDSDDATALFAFRHWRDESGRVLREACTVTVERPACALLCIASQDDADVPEMVTAGLADAWKAEQWTVRGDHVSPLLGRQAASLAARVADWLSRA